MGVISCPYRGPAIPGTKFSVCSHPEVRGPAVIGRSAGVTSCLTCPFWRHTPQQAAENTKDLPILDPQQWTVALPIAPVQTTRPQSIPSCQYRGDYAGRMVACLTGCKSLFKVFQCDVHTECTIGSAGVGIAGCCKTCPDRKPLQGDKEAGR